MNVSIVFGTNVIYYLCIFFSQATVSVIKHQIKTKLRYNDTWDIMHIDNV